MILRVHRIPHSTNVERVAIATALKGVAVEWVDHDPEDRSAIAALSGQELVPVAEFGAGEGGGGGGSVEVVADSIAILRRLEVEAPEPALWPAEEAERARAELFIAWFNGVWKVAPNALAAEPAGAEAARHESDLAASVALFEALVEAPYLAGAAPGITDVCAYPFLRYRLDAPGPGDDDPFHGVLHRCLAGSPAPRLDAWIARMAALAQA